ncbi:MAG: hypothetical protein LBH43_17895 [Treponema sp.]|jgi:hypothetical protein|nr:hypothetical protein [Treponema sp.]
MKETKFIEVGPRDVNSTIEAWASFGWELLGAPQEINYSTTHRTQETDDHYASEYTTTTNYVKITFQRDSGIPNYSQLAELQRQYDSIPEPNYPTPRFGYPFFRLFGFIPVSGWTILIALGLFLFIAPGILIIIWRCVSYSEKKKIWEEGYAAYKRKREEIAAKARSFA